ncbi:AraC family transcriptional regulator [Streptosporangium sp. KLBMP 9127]|nr:AraC family transcriptional regulator [Streptosporangium sp. KLBMP 9127]
MSAIAALHEHDTFVGGAVFGRVYELGGYELAGEVAPHVHDFLEIAVLGAGTGTHVTSHGERRMRQGDVIVLRPGAWHGFRDCDELTVANCCVSAAALRGELAPLREIPAFRRLLWTEPMAAGSHGVIVTRIEPAAAAEAIGEIALLARDLAAPGSRPGRTLGRLVSVLGILTDGREPERAAAPHPAVAAVIALLEDAPARQWRIADLAGQVSLDAAYLGRLFRRHVGLSPLAFLARVRAERAATLLARTTTPIARVGAAVGWDDPTYFARRFRDLVGLTPSDYRRRGGLGR